MSSLHTMLVPRECSIETDCDADLHGWGRNENAYWTQRVSANTEWASSTLRTAVES